jgi:hypothetical protein
MKLDVIAEIWSMTKESILSTDRDTVAENLVGILIDHDFTSAEIKSAFRGDYDVTTALKEYLADIGEFEDEEDAEYEEYEDEGEEDLDDYNDEWE